MPIEVRKASLHDADTISKLATETFYETYAWYNTPENMQAYTQAHFNPAQIRKERQQPDTYIFLAYSGQLPIGYAKMRNEEHPAELAGKKYLEIERIYVLKAYQKCKAGYALIKRCIEFGRRQMLDTIWLGVWEKNTQALAFYEKVGFRKFGRHIFTLGNDPQEDYLVKFDL